MDDFERKIKRLAIILAMSLAVIFSAKMLLTKTAINLNKANDAKQQAKAKPAEPPPSPEQPAATPDSPASVSAATAAESAMPATDNPAAAQ